MNILKNSFQYCFNFLLILLPFSALTSNFQSLAIEGVFVLCLLLAIPTFVKIDLDYLKKNKYQLIYCVFCLFIGLLNYKSAKNLIYGLKYELFYILIFLFFNSFKSQFNYQKSFKFFINSSFFALGSSFLIWAFTNNTFLVELGYRNDWSTFYLEDKQAFCQKLQDRNLCRFQGFLSSPNHFGLHLLFLNLLAKNFKLKILTFISTFLTFSRSSILAFLAFYALKIRNKIQKWQIFAGLGLFVLIVFYSVNYANLSSSEHISKFIENFPLLLDNFWIGHGLNFSGPASRVSTVLIPESHFLQVLLNTGFIGFTLFSLSFWDLVKRFWLKKKDNAYILIALLIPMLFLHPLEDSSLSIALFAYLALEDAFLSKK